jgi:hypothetical protein
MKLQIAERKLEWPHPFVRGNLSLVGIDCRLGESGILVKQRETSLLQWCRRSPERLRSASSGWSVLRDRKLAESAQSRDETRWLTAASVSS